MRLFLEIAMLVIISLGLITLGAIAIDTIRNILEDDEND